MKVTALLFAFSTFVIHQTTSFHVETTGVASPIEILGEHQEFEKTLQIYNTQAFEKLKLDVPGPVFVSYDPSLRTKSLSNATETSHPSYLSNTTSRELETSKQEDQLVAKVVMTGNATVLMDLYEVLPYKNNGIHLHLTNIDAEEYGYVMTYIYVAEPNLLHSLTTILPSVVVVYCHVLARKDKLTLSNEGSGSLFLQEQESMTLQSLDVNISGSGNIQFNLSSLIVSDSINSNIFGSGSIAIHTKNITSSKLETSISGDGAFYVVAKTFTTNKVKTSVFGNSIVSFVVSEKGQTEKQTLSISGSGSIYAGSVTSTSTKVDLFGNGIVYVSVQEELSVTAMSGEVFYVGERPKEVKTNNWFFWTSPVQPASTNKLINHSLVVPPPPTPELLALKLKHNGFSINPMIWESNESTSFQNMVMNSKITSIAHGPNGFLVFSGVAFGLVMIAMIAHGYSQHRVRREYELLV